MKHLWKYLIHWYSSQDTQNKDGGGNGECNQKEQRGKEDGSGVTPQKGNKKKQNSQKIVDERNPGNPRVGKCKSNYIFSFK